MITGCVGGVGPIKDSLTYCPSSQGWAPSPASGLKAGHPAPPQVSRLGTQPRPSSQGRAPSPAPGLKAGHPAPPQVSRLGTQPRPSSQGWAPRVLLSCFFRFVCCVFCVLCVLEVLSLLLSNFSLARML